MVNFATLKKKQAPISNTAKIFLIFGQSNAVGWEASHGLTNALYTNPIPNSYIYTTGDQIAQLQYGVNNKAYDNLSHGAELSMMYDLQAHYGQTIYLSKVAQGGVPISYFIPGGGTDLWSPIVNQITYLCNYILSLGKVPELVAALIDHGESNRYSTTYTANLHTVINNIRAINQYCSNCMLVIRRLSVNQINHWSQSVVDSQVEVGSETKNRWFSSDLQPLGGDVVHFTDPAQIAFGKMTAGLIIGTYQNGVETI